MAVVQSQVVDPGGAPMLLEDGVLLPVLNEVITPRIGLTTGVIMLLIIKLPIAGGIKLAADLWYV